MNIEKLSFIPNMTGFDPIDFRLKFVVDETSYFTGEQIIITIHNLMTDTNLKAMLLGEKISEDIKRIKERINLFHSYLVDWQPIKLDEYINKRKKNYEREMTEVLSLQEAMRKPRQVGSKLSPSERMVEILEIV